MIYNRKKYKVLLVRPPYHLWPIINESDNFLLPLNLPSLVAYGRRELPEIEYIIIDCLPLRIGWRSLGRLIKEVDPDLIGVGDMTVYMMEGMRCLSLAKEIKPEIVTVAGGHFHSHMPQYSLSQFPQLDYIVRYEGEETFNELLKTLLDGGKLSRVRSLAYRDDSGEFKETPPRPLIENLDELPIPAYDLMPIKKYSPFGKLWPRAITVQGARGCPYNCNFCSWSALEGKHVMEDGNMKLIPHLRMKSPDKMLEEIDYLYNEHEVRYLFWVEGTWNIDHKWLDDLCTGLIKREYNLGWWAFVRADLLLEQERLGILEKMVKAGLRHLLLGGERATDADLQAIGKKELQANAISEVLEIFNRKYPQVFRQATFLTGLPNETSESMMQLGRFTREIKLDFAAFHPIMPYPGTLFWEEANRNNWIEEEDFSKYDMFYPIMSSHDLSREKISELTSKLYLDFVLKKPLRYLKGLFSPHKIRRKLHWWFLFAITRVVLLDFWNSLLGRKEFEGFAAVNKLWKPSWYED